MCQHVVNTQRSRNIPLGGNRYLGLRCLCRSSKKNTCPIFCPLIKLNLHINWFDVSQRVEKDRIGSE